MEKPEIFAAGLNNPSGCSFDSNRPSYLYCADVNEVQIYYMLIFLIEHSFWTAIDSNLNLPEN